ncbi:MAG: metallophosphoesterase [Thermoguttaceae bacterium]
MPIHLPPISRRRFLASTLAASAGALLPRAGWGDEPASDPERFVLFADIHVPADRELAHAGVQPARNLQQAVAAIGRFTRRPSSVLVAGDCAFRRGEPGDYVTIGKLIKPLREAGAPVHLALGNHDDREHLLAAFPDARSQKLAKEVPEKCVSMIETPHADWFLLDSLDRTQVTPGRMGERQLAWLAKALDAKPDKPALVLAHHNPDARKNSNGLLDTQALFDVLVPRRRVKAYFFGHTHGWHLAQQAGIHHVNLPAMVWVFDKAQPRGFVAARLRPDGATLVVHALDHKHPKHGEKVELKWRA